MTNRRRHRFEHGLLTGFTSLSRLLPHFIATALGYLAATVTYLVLRGRMREARRRIGLVFGNRFSAREQRRIVWHAWRNLAISTVEVLRAPRLSDAWLERHANLWEMRQQFAPYQTASRGAVIACAHLGSWEMAAIAGHRIGLPAFVIAAPQRNPLFNEWMAGLRAEAGIETLLRGDPNLVRKVIRRLKTGRFLAILPDVRSAGGIPTPFLGGTAAIGPGMALFARLANVPILPCLTLRTHGGHHRFLLRTPIEPNMELDRDTDIERMTHAVMRQLETVILEQPHQWFWFNKRWILDPFE